MRDADPYGDEGFGSSPYPAGPSHHPGCSQEEHDAAVMIQRCYRGYTDRKRVGGMRLQRDARWDDLMKQSGEISYHHEQLDNKNDVQSRWKRAMHAASRLNEGDGLGDFPPTPPNRLYDDESQGELDEKERRRRRATFWGNLTFGIGGKKRDESEVLPYTSKSLEQQHWLEMIDGKHRYGSNVKYYFRAWKESDTKDNFFRWLDRGEGKDLSLEVLPRDRFERERIIYLSAEQRLNYLVKVDHDGLLRWVKNNELIDTAAGKWKDTGDGSGIIPNDSPDHTPHTDESDYDDDISDTYSATSSDLQDNEDTHYVGLDKKDQSWLKRQTQGITPSGIRKELLRKTVRRNTWIYVSDMKLNLFIGIKKSGAFQHSSFLGGGKVTSAGLIIVKRGRIKSLNPLSGHYRSSIEHYRAFIAQLEAKGVDLSHVKIAKSVLSLWGLSKYAAFTKGEKDLVSKFKATIGLPHEPTEAEKSAKLQENAEREEREHQARMKGVQQAEDEQDTPEAKERVRRERLHGAEKEEAEERKEDTKEGTRPV